MPMPPLGLVWCYCTTVVMMFHQVFAPTVLESNDGALSGETDDDASLTVEGSISTVRVLR